MMPTTITGAAPYAVLWGTQLAMTTALVGTMAGLWLRLRQPVMRALAWHWIARLAVVVINLLYFMSPDPTRWWLVPFAALFGTACGALYLTARDTVAFAAPESAAPPTGAAGATRPLSRTTVLVAGTAVALTAHLLNIGASAYSPVFAAVWTRTLHSFAYLCFLTWLVLRWLDHPTARHRLAPLVAGVTLSLGFDAFDAWQRALVLSGSSPLGGHTLTIVLSLTGTLCLGVGTLLGALESERDTLRRHADQLRTAEHEQANAQRLQSLGRLASGVAHDFNNVLGLIVNGIEFVDGALRPDQTEARSDLTEMRAAADRGVALTRRLLAFSRPNAVGIDRFSPAAAVRENLPMLQRLLSSRLALNAHVAGNTDVQMDRSQFEQLVINLLVNARDATQHTDGTVRLLLDEECVEHERKASVGRVTPGSWIRLSVIDDGVGIMPDVLPNLFEPFFTTKGDKGTGLGLATVAATVHEMHGAVDVYSTPGHGTRFDVWLPSVGLMKSQTQSGKQLLSTS